MDDKVRTMVHMLICTMGRMIVVMSSPLRLMDRVTRMHEWDQTSRRVLHDVGIVKQDMVDCRVWCRVS